MLAVLHISGVAIQEGPSASALRQLEPEAFTDAVFGVPTVTDILQELEKPGRDLLNASGVHPEAYSVVRRILATTKSELKTLIGNSSAPVKSPPADSW
jgi:transcriptional accessory protein Tex/SPT6